jgi:hypothetical protein
MSACEVTVTRPIRTVVVTPVQRVVEVQAPQRVIEVQAPQRVVEVQPRVRQIEIAARGLRGEMGPQGLPGETEGATFLVPAGETIHGLRVVRAEGGALFHPDLLNDAHAGQCIGIALQSGDAPAPLLVRAHGQISEASWSWSPGVVWCGADGQLTQTPSASGWLLQVARVITPTTISVDIDDAVIRS